MFRGGIMIISFSLTALVGKTADDVATVIRFEFTEDGERGI
jgi:hypothetical protein